MTEEQILAGAKRLGICVGYGAWSDLNATRRQNCLAWVRDVVVAMDGAQATPPPVTLVDDMWRKLVEASSS